MPGTPHKSEMVCDCCDRKVKYLRGSNWHGDSAICQACFIVWYDGPVDDKIDPQQIKAYVIKAEKENLFPFQYGHCENARSVT